MNGLLVTTLLGQKENTLKTAAAAAARGTVSPSVKKYNRGTN